MLKIPLLNSMRISVQRLWERVFGRRWFQLSEVTDRLVGLPGWKQEAFKSSVIAIVGCGALGGHLALSLARYGIGELWLFDDDCVEPSNLSRQPFHYYDISINKAEALRKHAIQVMVDKSTIIRSFPFRFENAVSAGLVSHPQYIFVGVDNDPSRRWAITYANDNQIPAVIAGLDGENLEGYVFIQKSQSNSPCPACFWPSLATSMRQAPCSPISAAINLTIVGISLAAIESLINDQPFNWDVKTISLKGNSEGSFLIQKKQGCSLCWHQ